MTWKLSPLVLVCVICLCACGGGSSGGGGTPPPPPAIAVSITTAPPSALTVNGTAPVAATVSNDSANAGVTWSCAPAGSCGSFNPTSTASGAPTTYTAPATVPSGTVTITATSKTDTTKSATSSPVTINPAGPAITVTISTAPPATLATSATATIAATTNDTAGVNWSCAPAGACGSFSPTSTMTTVTTTYTAPATVPSGGTVTITATSVTSTSVSASATVTISATASAATLKGQFAFLIQAPTGVRGTTTWVGSVNLDGAGNVVAVTGATGAPAPGSQCPGLPIAGMEDLISFYQPGAPQPANYFDQADPIVPTGATIPVTTLPSQSLYKVDATGHGQLVLSTCNGETLGMSFVLTSATHAEIIEADPAGGAGGDPASGTLDLQTPASTGFNVSQLNGNYSFTMSGIGPGTTIANTTKLAFGGVLSANGTATIGLGTIDVTSTGAATSPETIQSGIVDQLPDANGRGMLHIVVNSPGTSRTFVFYIVNSKVFRLMESDNIADMGGSAYLQPNTMSPSLSGSYVYQHSGWSSAGRTVAAGQFSVSGSSPSFTIAGVSDSNAGGAAPTTPSSPAAAVSGSAAPSNTEMATLNLTVTDAAGSSTLNAYLVDPSVNILDPNNSAGGGGALLLHTDTSIHGVGILLPQATPKAFSGNYALNLTNSIAATTPNELDLVGVLTADGAASFGTSNLADYDENDPNNSNPMIGAGLIGTFAADTTHAGRYTGSFTVTQPASSTTGPPYPFIPSAAFTVAIYPTGNSQAFIVETDNLSNIIGHLTQSIY